MKLNIVLKILAALAAVAGVVYVIATYGDKIVAWAKKLLGQNTDECECDCDCQCEADCDECPCESDCDECPCESDCDECPCCQCDEEDEIVEEEAAEEAEVSADEADFEG